MKLNLIYNRNIDFIIGVNGNLLCNIPDDFQWFQRITKSSDKNILIMGYLTWKDLPKKPLPGRLNIVVSNSHNDEVNASPSTLVFSTFEEVTTYLDTINYHKIFVIGGSQIFTYVFENYSKDIDCIYETVVDVSYDKKESDTLHYVNDTYDSMFSYETVYHKQMICNGKIYGNEDEIDIPCDFMIHQRCDNINHQEYQYIHLLKKIREEGILKGGRNSEVYSSFGEKMKFDLREGFPLLTTKKMGWKTILRELLWFLSGSTDNKALQEKNVHIWDQNASKEYMESRGLDYEEGDLGPVYGFQWRHFGEDYQGKDKEYKGGIDQIKQIIHLLKTEPTSRRIILSAWNPMDLDKMSLPPCHVMTQFNVDGYYLDAQLYQRSGDMFLGVPFNIASYAFLLHILGKLTGYIPRYLHHVIGDCHIYKSHIDVVDKQLERVPLTMTKIEVGDIKDIDDVTEEDIKIVDYKCDNIIKAQMVV